MSKGFSRESLKRSAGAATLHSSHDYEPERPVSVRRLQGDLERFGMLAPSTAAGAEQLLDIEGRPLGPSWVPLRAQVVDDEPSIPTIVGDLTVLGLVPVVSETAYSELSSILERYGEMLPIDLEDGRRMYLYNVTIVISCLDRKNMRGEFWLDEDRLVSTERYAFLPHELRSPGILLIPEQVAGPVFVTSDLVHQLRRPSRRGIACPLVWESARSVSGSL